MSAGPYQLFSKLGRKRSSERLELISNAQLPLSHVPGGSQEDRSNAPMAADDSSHNPGPSVNMLRSTRPKLLSGKNLKGLERFGLPEGSWWSYWSDIFHTMLNMPRSRFLAIFFAVYLAVYLVFTFFYLMLDDECIHKKVNFNHAFWFSVQTASTIGYSEMYPDPDCPGVNFLVTFQLIFASLVDYCMMGLVFARFAAPMPRAQTIRFSHNAVLYLREDGHWCLSFRVANIRKHPILTPEFSLMLAMPESKTDAAFRFVQLEVQDTVTQVANLKLGLPAIVSHIITPSSPLYELSLVDMEAKELEILCFLDGVDAMTSNSIHARQSYLPADVRMNERYTAINVQINKRGRLGLDFSGFDDTCVATVGTSRDDPASVLLPCADGNNSSYSSVKSHMQELRTKTIRSISFSHDDTTVGATATAAVAGHGTAHHAHAMHVAHNNPFQIGSPVSSQWGPFDPLGALPGLDGSSAAAPHNHNNQLHQQQQQPHTTGQPSRPGTLSAPGGLPAHWSPTAGAGPSQLAGHSAVPSDSERKLRELCEALLRDGGAAAGLKRQAGDLLTKLDVSHGADMRQW